MLKEVIRQTREDMQKAIDALGNDLSIIRTGRASTSLVEKIRVEYYGTATPMQQLALISIPEPQLIAIRPFDPSAIKEIERALLQSDLGITPNNDGKIIRLKIPSLTEERRRNLAKQVHSRVEETRITIRNHRRTALKDLSDLEKEKMITKDDFYEGKDEVQSLTDDFAKKAGEVGQAKEDEIMSI